MSLSTTTADVPFTFTPGLQVGDPWAAYWLRQVTVRLRREMSWILHEQELISNPPPDGVPVHRDKTLAAVNMQRFWKQKQQFFSSDLTAKYLSDQLESAPPQEAKAQIQGSFGWVLKKLELNEVEAFTLAMGLIVAFDSAAASVIAACLNDAARNQPTLALAQHLWDYPEEILGLADPAHALFHHGLLQFAQSAYTEARVEWERPINVPPLVARQLLFPDSGAIDGTKILNRFDTEPGKVSDAMRLIAARLNQTPGRGLQIVPVRGPRGAPYQDVVQALAGLRQNNVVQFVEDPILLKQRSYLDSLAAVCWLKGVDLYLHHDQLMVVQAERPSLELDQLPKASIPITLFIGIEERSQIAKLPAEYMLPIVDVPRLSYYERVQLWERQLGARAGGLHAAIRESARRFRFEKNTMANISRGLANTPMPLKPSMLLNACRAELELDLGELAQKVEPRFQDEDVILPPKQATQFQEIIKAMESLTEVHYEWGTEKVWNESGISVLFSGPPGTGKTMAAEILAIRLDLPMFRIDLSQVVSKYIGETEKNLKRLFDIADISDTILFFDEADALFGKRSEVKDAHDRYANLEISYLLERMERFKGLAILATNRKKDLDEAFLRRLRYIVDFPLPGEDERYRIWKQVIPRSVDGSQLDIGFLARQFALAGGHIRSIVFNACLQNAGQAQDPQMELKQFKGRLTMDAVVMAVKREYEKLNRSISLEQFGPYAKTLEKAEARNAGH